MQYFGNDYTAKKRLENAERDRDALQAQCAAMTVVLDELKAVVRGVEAWHPTPYQMQHIWSLVTHSDLTSNGAYDAGRLLLDRMAKLEAVAEAARTFRDMPYDLGEEMATIIMDKLSAALAALDAPTDGEVTND